MPDLVTVKQDTAGDWYWLRTDTGNNEPLSKSSESYVNKAHAIKQATELNPDTEIRVDDAEA